LGLPPLKEDTGPSKEELEKQQKEREELEKEMKAVELAGKIEKMKNKRLLTQKIAGKSIAEGILREEDWHFTCSFYFSYSSFFFFFFSPLTEVTEEDDDPMAWIEKSRKLEAEKALAAQRAKMLDEMDEEEQEADIDMTLPAYTERNLAGLKIAHNVEQFNEGEEILVLKDTAIVGKDGNTPLPPPTHCICCIVLVDSFPW